MGGCAYVCIEEVLAIYMSFFTIHPHSKGEFSHYLHDFKTNYIFEDPMNYKTPLTWTSCITKREGK